MGLFGKKKGIKQTSNNSDNNYKSMTDDEYNEKLKKLHDEFVENDFIYLCSKVESNLDFYVELFAGKSVKEVHELIESNQDIDLRNKFLSAISIYDELTSTGRLNDLRRNFVREDIDGYRYNDFGWVVCYPKIVYDEKRKEFTQYYQTLQAYIICEKLFV